MGLGVEALDEGESTTSSPDDPPITKVGEVPLFEEPIEGSSSRRDGWILINPRTRRGYQIFSNAQVFPNETIVWSFSLDSFLPLKRLVIKDFKVLPTGLLGTEGEIVHSLDEEGGRIFLAGTNSAFLSTFFLVEIDEGILDEAQSEDEATSSVRKISVPTTQAAQLAGSVPEGMTYVEDGDSGKIILLFTVKTLAPVDVTRPLHVHWLVQWDLNTGNGDWALVPEPCQRAPLRDPNSGGLYQLPVLRGDSSILVGCQASGGVAQAVQIPLDSNGFPDASKPMRGHPTPQFYADVLVDQKSERLAFLMEFKGLTWAIFDGKAGSWVGSVGVALAGVPASAGIDPLDGRLYTLVPNHQITTPGARPGEPSVTSTITGGLSSTTLRLTPVPQIDNGLPQLAYPAAFRIRVDPAEGKRSRRIYVRRGSPIASSTIDPEGRAMPAPLEDFYTVLEDANVESSSPSIGDLDQLTIGQPEEEGISGATFDGLGAGYGFRALLIGGVNAPVSRELDGQTTACYRNDREFVIGEVENASLTNLSVAARSYSLRVDEGTRADLEAFGSRCWPFDWIPIPTSTFTTLDPVVGSQANQPWEKLMATCTGDEEVESAHRPLGRRFDSSTHCQQSGDSVGATGSGSLSVPSEEPLVSIGASWSHAEVQRGQEGGIVTTVEAVARGIEIAGVGRIEMVRTVAKSWSTGVPKQNGASFERIVCGVHLPNFERERCFSDEQNKQLIDALNRVLGGRGEARLRQPDAELAKGSPGGYLAGIQRDRMESISDALITRDSSQAVPGLEIIFYRGDDPKKGSGRQVFQFAAVQASSSYGVFCLFGEIHDDESVASCVRPSSELRVELTDDFEENPTPLPGGVFQIHLDEDGDGILGVDDAVLELGDKEAVCATTGDGVGDCVFELPPGNYIVHQVEAPDGFAPSPDCAVFLPAFTSLTCEFANSPNIGLIYVGLTDDSAEANPLAGGVLELYVDDGDQKLGAGDTKLASCTTDVFGDCVYKLSDISGKALPISCTGSPTDSEDLQELIKMECVFDSDKGGNILAVELGTFIVHQTAAPPDYSVAEDQILQLVNPWDIGIASFVNGLAPVEGTPPIEIPGTPARASTSVVEGGTGPRTPVVQSEPKSAPAPQRVVTKILRAPAEALSFLLRHPKEAVMFASMWLMLAAPLWLMIRRRSITGFGGLSA